MKKALKYLISVIIAIIVAGFFIYLLIPALTGLMTLVGIVVVIAIVSDSIFDGTKENKATLHAISEDELKAIGIDMDNLSASIPE